MKKGYKAIVIILLVISLLSKMTGMLKESFIATAFGVSYKVDAYNIAYLIPFLLFSLIGPALTTTFIPILSEAYENDGKKEMYALANNIISIILGITLFIFFIGEIFPEIFVDILAPNFNVKTRELTIYLTKISLINVLFIGLNYGFVSILNVLGEFTSTGISGLLLNIPIVIYIVTSKNPNIEFLMIYTMVGYGLQILAHIPFLIKHKYKYKFKINLYDKRIKKILILIIPIIIGIGVNQINVIVDRMMASGLQEGTISAMGYANKVNEIMYTMFTSSVMVVIFPIISKQANKNDNFYLFKSNIYKVEQITKIIIIPATLLLAYLRTDVITIIFKYGSFNEEALLYTSNALFYLSFSTIFYCLRDVYNKGLLALQDTKSSVINTSLGMLVNITLNLLTVNRLGIVGLTISTTLSSLVTCHLLKRTLYKKINKTICNYERIENIKIYTCSLIMILSLISINSIIKDISILNSICRIAINGIIGISIFIISAYILNIKEIKYLLKKIKIKSKKLGLNI